MPDKTANSRRTTADLARAVKSYCARLPLVQAVQFAASLWGVSAEEALRRLDELPPRAEQAEETGRKPLT
jgi:hypothetical protein